MATSIVCADDACCAFSPIKRKFGDSVRAKNDQSMRNEVLAKFVCWNRTCLIHAMDEFGTDPSFNMIPATPIAMAR